MKDILNNKIRGSLLGGAIGDALGYQIEFKRGIKEKQVTRFQKDIGIISDDTQMTLFTATSLLWNITNSVLKGTQMNTIDAVYRGYLDWLDTQKGKCQHDSISWIKSILELNKRRAPGNTCIRSLDSGKRGSIENPINDSKGCGTVMRIAPFGLSYNNPDYVGELAAKASALTHGHMLAIIPSYVCASMINMLTYNETNIEQALYNSIKVAQNKKDFFQEKQRLFAKDSMTIFIDLVNKAVKLSKENLSDTVAIRQLGEGWTAEEAFAIALYSCLKYPNSFEDAIVCAVNHDGDSDSTGAIAGNIMGALLGLSNIPEYYSECVELRNVVLEIADDLQIINNSDYDFKSDENWMRKYHECKLHT